VAIDAVALSPQERLRTGIGELDRVLGGGIVAGSLILIGGDPGIGKSTLMLQALEVLGAMHPPVLYISGEESVRQMALRSRRLGIKGSRLLVLSEIEMDAITTTIEKHKPAAVVIDSIQTMFSNELSAAPGSVSQVREAALRLMLLVSQVREAALRLMLLAKQSGVPIFIVGHVTKDGAIAGPRLLEHMVDTVLYFEGDRNHIFRILRAVKNRFGSTNEIGVFEMTDSGLQEVSNPSALFLTERPKQTPGSVVTCSMEGTRPILVELQALVSGTAFGTPRRTVLGLDAHRVSMLTAVMEKRLEFHLSGHDIYMNVAGGVKIDEPAVDVAIVAAVASSFLDRPLRSDTVILGEVGLTGEIRAVGQTDSRLAEAGKMGFSRCLLPSSNKARTARRDGLRLVGVDRLEAAIEALF
jgi:DNA repair protein RadA/Sms